LRGIHLLKRTLAIAIRKQVKHHCRDALFGLNQLAWLSFLAGLPILVDSATDARAWTDTMALARQHGLNAYDAAYLELAMRAAVPLATLDGPLIAAATSVGVARYQP
jgi:predicted nucleic acid-binding protein